MPSSIVFLASSLSLFLLKAEDILFHDILDLLAEVIVVFLPRKIDKLMFETNIIAVNFHHLSIADGRDLLSVAADLHREFQIFFNLAESK